MNSGLGPLKGQPPVGWFRVIPFLIRSTCKARRLGCGDPGFTLKMDDCFLVCLKHHPESVPQITYKKTYCVFAFCPPSKGNNNRRETGNTSGGGHSSQDHVSLVQLRKGPRPRNINFTFWNLV